MSIDELFEFGEGGLVSPVVFEEEDEFARCLALKKFPAPTSGSAVKVSNSGETYFSRPYR